VANPGLGGAAKFEELRLIAAMISVKVKLFATLRQQAGWSEKSVEAPAGSTLGDLMKLLMEAYPNLKLTGRAVYAAVNQNYAKPDHPLVAGDEVAIFPPVSGGALECEEAA
jgi:molybdopterin converting factor subunit 1